MYNQIMFGNPFAGFFQKSKSGFLHGMLIVFVLAVCVCFLGHHVTKADRPHSQKLITKVEVKAGDSVWQIAEQYYSSEFGSLNDYIQEIEDINGISAEYVQAGGCLTIPYYEESYDETSINYQ
ncbi:MAG: LysM peptidoglycan-binding domain-containing protein [Clostridiales bacterium]|nr:LysM peptidoglycan-binding domain-containing protein [Clostridiales bacterium]